jgi:hypothetical protein
MRFSRRSIHRWYGAAWLKPFWKQAGWLRRVQLEGQLIESRLATAEAQVDPQMLFSALAEIRDGFSRSSPDADAKLDDLVQQLRNALTRTRAVDGEDSANP